MEDFMHPEQGHSAFDLLGQAEKPVCALRLPAGEPPQLDVAWGSFRQSLASSALILFGGPIAPKKFFSAGLFRDCWIERRMPRRAVIAAALWHVALFILPWPDLPAAQRRNPALEDVELTWSGPINDLPFLDLPGARAKPSPRGEPDKPLPPRGADAFHPRQRIFTDPAHPTHPRQTLIQPASSPAPPKILPNLPNIVQLAPSAQPARPRLAISAATLAKLRPRERRRAAVSAAPDAPILAPNLEPKIGEISLAASSSAPARPKMQIDATSAPRLAERTQSGDAAPAPELGSAVPGSSADGPGMLIALSATPAAPSANVQVPEGNLSARISISPEGTQRGVPGGAENGIAGSTDGAGGSPGSLGGEGTGGGGTATAVSISGGRPGNSSGISGLGGNGNSIHVTPAHTLPGKPQPHVFTEDTASKSAPPNFGALPPGAKPEDIFGPKRVYTLHVNMPNLNSVTGSWVLSFSEMRDDPDGRPVPLAADLTGPVPLRKVDPKYPPSLISERVEGEVILYAVIRRDGSVDSIQLVHGLDEQLDANAMDALSRWKFRAAERQGAPVELETVVRIPFRAIARPY